MIARYNNTSMALAVPGLIVQVVGQFVLQIPYVTIAGTVLVMVGLGYYAKAKGRHWAWGLLGLLSIFGLIALAILPDKAKSEDPDPRTFA
jgi:4-amino-4-deoxy-L-arabinose transferase-like glycosyltransferase